MFLRHLEIKNFRGIGCLKMCGIGDSVVVAGPNGCGKSSIFDAIRLIKSAYGQYFDHEYRQFFQEFQVNVNNLALEARRFLGNADQELLIHAKFELSEKERSFLAKNAERLILNLLWSRERGVGFGPIPHDEPIIDPVIRNTRGPTIAANAKIMHERFQANIQEETIDAKLTMRPGEAPEVESCAALELIFNIYDPENLGVIDYHGPNRNFAREQLGGINLQIDDASNRNRQHALYNTESKYRNVKSEMAQSYIRQLLANNADFGVGVGIYASETSLGDSLKELFEIFFPGKKFNGPKPTSNGELSFLVTLSDGREHDIDDLSSGEKEVLLGYLRLRASSPKNSIILLDEPELHLNPRLTRGLPGFYEKHLGKAFGNQIWLITHSDSLLRAAVVEASYSVFHMDSIGNASPTNQIEKVSAGAELERAVIALCGDLATYSPRSKVVIMEGIPANSFDTIFIDNLFPEFSQRVNLVAGGNKTGVKVLQISLQEAAKQGKIDARFFSITDRDFDGSITSDVTNQFAWDVYHIENFLLEPKFIQMALDSFGDASHHHSEDEIIGMLRECARQIIEEHALIRVRSEINRITLDCLNYGYDRNCDYSVGLNEAVTRSASRLLDATRSCLSANEIRTLGESFKAGLIQSLEDGSWRAKFRGRDVLKRFVGAHCQGIKYEYFRNLIMSNMRQDRFQPPGMKLVIDAIISAK